VKYSNDELIERFKDFFQTYPDVADPKYQKEIRDMHSSDKKSILINFDDIINFDDDLADQYQSNPEETFITSCTALKTVVGLVCTPTKEQEYFARVYNLPKTIRIKKINVGNLQKLSQIHGMVSAVLSPEPYIKEAVFSCERCGEYITIIQTNEQFKKPITCPSPACGRNGPFILEERFSKFIDSQILEISDTLEDLQGGEIPRTLQCLLFQDIVDTIPPGARIKVTGALKPVQQVGGNRAKKNTFDQYLLVNSIILAEEETQELVITDTEEKQIQLLKNNPNLIKILTSSFAVKHKGDEDIKLALLMQLAGRDRQVLQDGTVQRGDSHILLFGDPATGKSELLKASSRLMPRGVYASADGASGCGLTVSAKKVTDLKWSFSPGVLPLAHKGIACVAKGQKVLTSKGLKNIEDIKIGDVVVSYEKSAVLKQVTNKYSNGVKKVIKIKTFAGTDLIVTPDHKIFTRKGWVCASDIKKGDFLKIPCMDKKFQIEQNLDFIKGRIMGFALSDLTYARKKNAIAYSTSLINLDRAEYYNELIERAYGVKPKRSITRKNTTHGLRGKEIHFTPTTLFYCASKQIKQEMIEVVEDRIDLTNHNWILGFLTGILDTDCCICNHNGKFGIKHTIEIALVRHTKSTEWLKTKNELMVSLFALLGIQAYIRGRKVFITSQKSFNLCAMMFGDDLIGRNAGKLRFFEKHKKITADDSLLDEEYSNWFRNVKFNTPATVRNHVSSRIWYATSKDRVTDELMETLEMYWESITREQFKPVVKNYILNKVVSVEDYGDSEVFDLTINGVHNFTVSGCIVHNCIDEIDKISEEDRGMLHPAMESQTISMHKAGIHTDIPAQCPILAGANPKSGKLDPNKPFLQQIDLIPTLLSRFDLLIAMRDKNEFDLEIAMHILNGRVKGDKYLRANVGMDDEFLKKYIFYVRKHIHPKMSDAIIKKIAEKYVHDRKNAEITGASTMTKRQLEGFERMASQLARLLQQDEITEEIVDTVFKIYNSSIEMSLLDPETGMLDVSMIDMGRPKSQRDKLTVIMGIISQLDKKNNNEGAIVKEVYEDTRAENIPDSFTRKIIDELKQKGDVYEPRPDRLKLTLVN
jgi:DNA replicative helicase MCM subunit Mcm2 (Cdc46/Mcm family)/intein/homing endonuclease